MENMTKKYYLVVLVCMTAIASGALLAQGLGNDGIFDRDNAKRRTLSVPSRMLLNRAELHGSTSVPVTIAARRGAVMRVAASLKEIGGEVKYLANDVDYLRGEVPVAAARQFAEQANIVDIDFGTQMSFLGDGANAWPDEDHVKLTSLHTQSYNPPERDSLATSDLPIHELSALNPILPTDLIGAPQFVHDHPEFDGRGVTSAVLDATIGDLSHPMLQTARLVDGTVTRKVIDILDPRTSSWIVDGDGVEHLSRGFVDLKEISTDRDGHFRIGAKEYVAPASGAYQFGELQEIDGVKQTLTILWSEEKDLVWLGTRGSSDFRNETGIKSFSITQDTVAVRIGADDVALAVKTDKERHTLRVYESGEHATAAASIAAGTNLLGTPATGTAPGSRIIFVVPSDESEVESILMAARDPRVDLITASFSAIEGSWVDGVQSLILNRIVATYRKPILNADGDGGALGASSGWKSGVQGVIAIGTYSDHDTEDAHRQLQYRNNESEYVNFFSDSGPSGLGGLKPDFLAPSLTAWAVPCRTASSGTVCAEMGEGAASFATPMAAGGVALLISAAKQVGIPYDASRLRYALEASARHLRQWPIERQGGGLIQVQGAWDQLVGIAKSDPPEILSAAEISTTDVSSNRIPGYGVSIFDWEGWHPGEDRERSLFLLRNNGPDRLVSYDLQWIENDGTFSSMEHVELGLHEADQIHIRIHPVTSGMHTSLLRLLDSTTHAFVAQFGIYIVSAEPLSPSNDYEAKVSGVVTRNRGGSSYLDIPRNTLLLELSLHFDAGNIEFQPWRPEWLETGQSSFPAATPSLDHGVHPGYITDATMLLPRTTPGVWQFLMTNRQVEPPPRWDHTRYELSARAIVGTGDDSQLAEQYHLEKRVSEGRVYEVPLRAVTKPASFYRFSVGEHTSELAVSLTSSSLPTNKTLPELYLYRCSGQYCRLWTHKCGEEVRAVTIHDPIPGVWVASSEYLDAVRAVEAHLQIVELLSATVPHQGSETPVMTVRLPESAVSIRDCEFRPANVTQYVDREAELREILSPLNAVQTRWDLVRPTPLIERVTPIGAPSCQM